MIPFTFGSLADQHQKMALNVLFANYEEFCQAVDMSSLLRCLLGHTCARFGVTPLLLECLVPKKDNPNWLVEGLAYVRVTIPNIPLAIPLAIGGYFTLGDLLMAFQQERELREMILTAINNA